MATTRITISEWKAKDGSVKRKVTFPRSWDGSPIPLVCLEWITGGINLMLGGDTITSQKRKPYWSESHVGIVEMVGKEYFPADAPQQFTVTLGGRNVRAQNMAKANERQRQHPEVTDVL